MRILKMLAKIHRRCSTPKRSLWKKVVAKIGATLSGVIVKVIMRLAAFRRWQSDVDVVKRLASSLVENARDRSEAIERLCRFVNREIQYFPLDSWLSPEEVLRYGIGDCKNQAVLLQALLRERAIETEVVVGLTNWRTSNPKIHAWLSIRNNGTQLIADPTFTEKPISPCDYRRLTHGFIDLTAEYEAVKSYKLH